MITSSPSYFYFLNTTYPLIKISKRSSERIISLLLPIIALITSIILSFNVANRPSFIKYPSLFLYLFFTDSSRPSIAKSLYIFVFIYFTFILDFNVSLLLLSILSNLIPILTNNFLFYFYITIVTSVLILFSLPPIFSLSLIILLVLLPSTFFYIIL